MRSQTSSGATTPTRRIRRPRFTLSPERLSEASFVGLLTVLEVAPIQAALLLYAASAHGSLAVMFGPLWLIVAALLTFALARWRLGRRNPVWLTSTVLLIGVVAIALFVTLSPTAYGDAVSGLPSPDWLQQLRMDALRDTPHFNSLFGIAPFVVYLGWRGLALGAPPPKSDVTLRRYTISLAAVIVTCIGALTAPSEAQASLQGALLALLALDVFAGLAAAALARRGGGHEAASDEATGAETTRWLLTAFGAAALVVGLAFALGLLLNLRLTHPLAVALESAGAALTAAVVWLATALAYVLWFIFANTIGRLLFQKASPYVPPQQSTPIIPKHAPAHQALTPPPHALVVAAIVLVALVLVALVIYFVYRFVSSALRFMRPVPEPEVDEEREALDARGLLRRQMRDLLASLRRRPDVEADPLARGGVRWLYREMLRAGAAAGIARRTGETADEYSERLTRFAQERGAGELGLTTLTRAYDETRYGERAADAPPDALAEAHAASSTLARLHAER